MFSVPSRWRDFDLYMLVTTLVLMGFGTVAVYSAANNPVLSLANQGVKQAIYGIGGLVVMVVIARMDYRLFSSFSWIIYVSGVLLLMAVMVVGTTIAGAQRWIFIGSQSIQPAEFGKLATIIALAAFISKRGTEMRQPINFLLSLAIVGLPMALVFIEPDLGTSLVYIVIWISMMLVARTRPIYFLILGILAIPGTLFAWSNLFQEYQKARLLISYDPYSDPSGAGFNIIQARLSIGSGGLFGHGLLGGTQSRLDLLAVRESDFIFAHASGMFGFVGMIALFLSLVILIWRCLRVAESARDSFGQMVALGTAGMLFFQATVNIGMNIGLLPVTGITLPFVSSGVSSLWTFLAAEGMLQAILMRQRKLGFQPG